jgi:hypothetical protein
MSKILNGVCVGGPLNDRGLTWDKDVKVLLASNNDGHAGEYHYDHAATNKWIWLDEGKEQTMSRAAEEQTIPRITPEIIDKRIVRVKYYQFPDSTVMICAIELTNGYHVIGEAGCSSPLTFDETIARRISFDDARRKIWPLEGYVLRNELKGL